MAGANDWLDTLVGGAVDIAGRAVDYSGQVSVARATAGAREADTTPVPTTSVLQTAPITMPVEWLVIGGLVIVGVVWAIKSH